jgi:NAD(P)-dependent dehydrogenase (short-subunit alcohol dehydrogenase family)
VTEPPSNYIAPPQLLQDRVILVTGAGDGIGKAAACCFAAHGASVILVGRTVSKLEATYDLIATAGHPQAAIFVLDMLTASSEDYQGLAASIGQEFGQLHGLLHNASILGQQRPVESARPDEWQAVMQVNVNAQMMLTQALLPVLGLASDASIIFTSSGVGRKGRAFWGAYAVSKFATEGLMQVLADELENTTQIRVNSLNPGATRTAMRAAAYPAENPNSLKTPAQIMPAYLYLMGADSIDVNGQALDAQSVSVGGPVS